MVVMYSSRSNITNVNVYMCPNSVPTTNLSVQLIFTTIMPCKPLVELHLLDQEYYRHKTITEGKKKTLQNLFDSNKPSLDHRRVS